MEKKKKKIVLIDGNALLYRAFYALPPLESSRGIPTGAIYGFTRMLLKLLREEKPEYLACAFDKGKKTFRHREWDNYKATRPPTPEGLSPQIGLVKRVLEGFGIPIYEETEYEADDILGTMAKRAEKEGFLVRILTGDKDALQIVSPSIHILRGKKGISEIEVFDEKKVKEVFGVSPSRIPDLLALAGDVSDNIPGVPGIGLKTARLLLEKYQTLEGVYANLSKLPPRLEKLLREHREQAKLSKKLSTLITTVPLSINWEKFRVKEPSKERLLPLFQELEFKVLIEELNLLIPFPRLKEKTLDSSLFLEKILPSLPSPLSLWLEKEGVWLAGEKEIYFVPLKDREERRKVFLSLSSSEIKKVSHGTKEQMLLLLREGFDPQGWEFDLEIAAYLLDPEANLSLCDLSLRYLGKSVGKNLGSSQKTFLIQNLYPWLKKKLEEERMEKIFFELELPLIKVLARMEEKGIKLDKDSLSEFLKEIKAKRKALEEEIYGEVGERFNLNSPQKLSTILFEKLRFPPLKKTKTGYSTDEEVLRTLALEYPLCQKILEYRMLFKLETSYIEPLPRLILPSTGRIHTSFHQTGTVTGRISSSHPNLQNIPIKGTLGERLRKCFIPEEGWFFLSADYSQIDLRVLAELSGDGNLRKAFLRGEDIHRETASWVFGVLPLQVTPRLRNKAKAVNFGIIYGISPYGLSRQLRISPEQAKGLIERYFECYPGVKKFIEKTLEEAEAKGYVKTILGRRRFVPGLLSPQKREREQAKRIAINTPVQGSSADIIKLAMVKVDYKLQEKGLKARLILQIHDELLLEVPEKELEKTRQVVKEEMEGAIKLSVPLRVETKVGKNWGELF